MRIVKTFNASGAIGHRRQVKATANDGEVAIAGAGDEVIGVTDFPSGAQNGERIDVVLFGLAEVVAGGAIAPLKQIMAGAGGIAVAAAPAAGVNAYVGGRVLNSAVNGDFVTAFVNPTRIQG